MANIKAKEKSHLQDEKTRKISHSKKSELRTSIKKTKTTKSSEELSKTYSLADKAAKKNRIHKNKANRIKSRVSINISKK